MPHLLRTIITDEGFHFTNIWWKSDFTNHFTHPSLSSYEGYNKICYKNDFEICYNIRRLVGFEKFSLKTKFPSFSLHIIHQHHHCVNTEISPNLLVWKFCGKAQFPHQKIRWNLVILRSVHCSGSQLKDFREIRLKFACK